MPALNFQRRFAEMVADGTKRQTIRAMRKYPIRHGDSLYLYTGMRTKACRLLKTVSAREVYEISLSEAGVRLYGQALHAASIQKLAIDDGFQSVDEFRDFFRRTHGFPFRGQLIKW